MKILLDTHILLWWLFADRKLPKSCARLLARVPQEGPAWVSDITLWEIAMLVELGRIEIDIPLRDWLEAATAPPQVERISISPAIAAEVAALPTTFHRDPADRIIVATARMLDAKLLSADRAIHDSGLVTVVG